MGSEPSIHHRRRWYYTLWGSLLLGSLTALTLWEIPAMDGIATVKISVELRDLPAEAHAKIWTGPRESWRGGKNFQDLTEITTTKESVFTSSAIPLRVAYRRWTQDYVPRRTADLLVIRFETPGQSPRYLPISFVNDWRTGLLKPRRKIQLSFTCGWNQLTADPSGFHHLE